MSVTAFGARGDPGRDPAPARVSSLTSWLAKAADQAPDRLLLYDQTGRVAWSGRPASRLTARDALRKVRRLSSYLRGLRLGPGARVGICLPNGSEACLSLLAVEDAGLTPCLLNASETVAALSSAIEAGDIRAVITQGFAGEEHLAEKLCLIAAGFFRLSFIMAFGPSIPDGVADLDAVLADDRDPGRPDGQAAIPAGEPGIVSFARGPDGVAKAVFRSRNSLVAATAAILPAMAIRPRDHIASVLAPDDLKGLATGFLAALLTGATFAPCAVLEAGIADSADTTHLVVPAWTETAVADSRRFRGWSLILVHAAPTEFGPQATALDGPVVDVLSLGEVALLAGIRRPGTAIGSSLLGGFETDPHKLLDLELDGDGVVHLRGIAAISPGQSPPTKWFRSDFVANRTGGTISGVTCRGPEPWP